MTVDGDYIAAYTNNRITIGTPGTVPSATFTLYKSQAELQVGNDAPGISGVQYDELLALAICSRIDALKGRIGVSGEKIGADMSYSKVAEKGEYDIRYDSLIVKYKNSLKLSVNGYIEHADSDPARSSPFDKNSLPSW